MTQPTTERELREAFESRKIWDTKRNYADDAYYYKDTQHAFVSFCDGYLAALPSSQPSPTLSPMQMLRKLKKALLGASVGCGVRKLESHIGSRILQKNF